MFQFPGCLNIQEHGSEIYIIKPLAIVHMPILQNTSLAIKIYEVWRWSLVLFIYLDAMHFPLSLRPLPSFTFHYSSKHCLFSPRLPFEIWLLIAFPSDVSYLKCYCFLSCRSSCLLESFLPAFSFLPCVSLLMCLLAAVIFHLAFMLKCVHILLYILQVSTPTLNK